MMTESNYTALTFLFPDAYEKFWIPRVTLVHPREKTWVSTFSCFKQGTMSVSGIKVSCLLIWSGVWSQVCFHGCLVRCSKKKRREKLHKGFFPFVSNLLLDASWFTFVLFSLLSVYSFSLPCIFPPPSASSAFFFSYCQLSSLLEHLVEVCSFLLLRLSCSLTSLSHLFFMLGFSWKTFSVSFSWSLCLFLGGCFILLFSLFIHASLCTSWVGFREKIVTEKSCSFGIFLFFSGIKGMKKTCFIATLFPFYSVAPFDFSGLFSWGFTIEENAVRTSLSVWVSGKKKWGEQKPKRGKRRGRKRESRGREYKTKHVRDEPETDFSLPKNPSSFSLTSSFSFLWNKSQAQAAWFASKHLSSQSLETEAEKPFPSIDFFESCSSLLTQQHNQWVLQVFLFFFFLLSFL